MPRLTETERHEIAQDWGFTSHRLEAHRGDRESWYQLRVWDNEDIKDELRLAAEYADQALSECPCTCRSRFPADPSCDACQGSGEVAFSRESDDWKRRFERELAELLCCELDPSPDNPGRAFYGGGSLTVGPFRTSFTCSGGLDI